MARLSRKRKRESQNSEDEVAVRELLTSACNRDEQSGNDDQGVEKGVAERKQGYFRAHQLLLSLKRRKHGSLRYPGRGTSGRDLVVAELVAVFLHCCMGCRTPARLGLWRTARRLVLDHCGRWVG